MIAFEMTGQLTHIVPAMLAVLIANATAALLQPSMYDSIIVIKKLPYLPDLLPSGAAMYNIFVEHFMVRDVKFIWQKISYAELKTVLKVCKFITLKISKTQAYISYFFFRKINIYEVFQ